MPVPDYQSLMLPTLKALSDGVETSISELRARIATAGGLTQEDVSEKLPSGRQTVFANRVGWALLGLDRAGLVQRVRRAVYRLTTEGGRLLARELRGLMMMYFAPTRRLSNGRIGRDRGRRTTSGHSREAMNPGRRLRRHWAAPPENCARCWKRRCWTGCATRRPCFLSG